MNLRHAKALVLVIVAGSLLALNGEQYLRQAMVSPSDARALALKTFPGKIVSEELEHETGGSGLRYSFVIRHGKTKHEVGIDAKTGKVLENSIEGENPD